MKVLTYITAVAALVFGMNTTNAATIEKSNVVVEAAKGSVDARLDRSGETLSISMKASDTQRALIQLKKGSQVIYENLVLVDAQGANLDIDMTQFGTGVFSLTVKGNDFQYANRFKNK